MKACIINIGDEILIGQIINTNAAWMAQELNKYGFSVVQTLVIADEKEAIIEAVKVGFQSADIVLMTGGLGPTKDDITKKTLADYFSMELVYHPATFDNIVALFKQYGREADDRYKLQSYMPEGATVLINKVGTASGMWFEREAKVLVSMPGVPREVHYLMQEEALPRLQKQFKTPYIQHKTLLTTGKGETDLSEMLEGFEEQLPSHIKLAYLPNTNKGMVRLRLSAHGDQELKLAAQLVAEADKIKSILGTLVFGEEEEHLESVVGKLLQAKGLSLATAESCTGGRIAHKITSVAGSSAYYHGSVVAYSNAVKVGMLKVPEETIAGHGAVSEACVRAMVVGTQQLFGVECAMAVSGIAGPGGARPGKPVGTIWIAIAQNERLYTKKLQLGDDRNLNITRTTNIALNLMRKMLIDDLEE